MVTAAVCGKTEPMLLTLTGIFIKRIAMSFAFVCLLQMSILPERAAEGGAVPFVHGAGPVMSSRCCGGNGQVGHLPDPTLVPPSHSIFRSTDITSATASQL